MDIEIFEKYEKEYTVLKDIQENDNLIDYILDEDKSSYTSRDILDLIEDYIDTPYLFAFVNKSVIIANLLYPHEKFLEIDMEYNEILRSKIFPEKIKFESSVKKEKTLLETFSSIDEKVSNFNIEAENVDLNKMKDFDLSDYVTVEFLYFKSIVDELKNFKNEESSVGVFVENIEEFSDEEIINMFLPMNVEFNGNYIFEERGIEVYFSEDIFENVKDRMLLESKDFIKKNKSDRRKYLKTFYTASKIFLSIAYPPSLPASLGEGAKAVIDLVDIAKDSGSVASGAIKVEVFDIRSHYINFRNSNKDSVKEYFIEVFKEAVSEGFKRESKMNIVLGSDVYDAIYREFYLCQLFPVLEQLDDYRMSLYNDSKDKDRFLLEYLYDEKVSEVPNIFRGS